MSAASHEASLVPTMPMESMETDTAFLATPANVLHSRIFKGALATVAALSVAACTSEGAPVAAAPSNAISTVSPGPDVLAQPIDFSSLAYQLDAAKTTFSDLKFKDPATHQDNYINLDSSASVLSVTYQNGRLLYKDQTPGSIMGPTTLQGLTDIVSADAPYLIPAFQDKEVDSIQFRVLKSNPGEQYDRDFPVYVANDYVTGTKHSTIYDIIDPDQPHSLDDMRTMLRHETIHALTGRSSLSESTGKQHEASNTSQQEAFASACDSVRNVALGEITTRSYGVAQELDTKAAAMPAAYATILRKAVSMITDGTIEQYEPHSSEPAAERTLYGDGNVPECKLIGPWYIALRLMQQQGLDLDVINKTIDSQPDNSIYNGIDDWNYLLGQTQIESNIREATYLSNPGQDSLEGHPWDNWDESVTSTLDVALTYPDEFIQRFHALPSVEAQAAVRQLLIDSAGTLQALHPDMKQVNTALQNVISSLQ